jgi:peptidoglycan/LPS O-acetylase OafA/YrhL
MQGSSERTDYLPSLDGWRAIAILSVILFHDWSHGSDRLTDFMHLYGSNGVDLFFAISGILICSRLLAEERMNGFISLRSFYIRRMFRIFPAAWAFLLFCVLLTLLRQIPEDAGGLLTSLLMVRNFWVRYAGDIDSTWYTIHFWSLSVEEHFYLILPGLLVFFSPRKRPLILGAMACVSIIWMEALLHFRYLQVPGFPLRSDFRMAALMIPAFFAVLLSRENIRDLATRWLPPWAIILIFTGCELLAQRSTSAKLATLSALIIPIGFPLIVISTMLRPRAMITRILEFPPLRFIGRISYSLYLWQQLFFLMQHHGASYPMSVTQLFPLNYLCSLACALGSYYLIEKPAIRFGRGLVRRKIAGRESPKINVPGEGFGVDPSLSFSVLPRHERDN